MRLREISGRLTKLERGGTGCEGIVCFSNGATRAVHCKDVCALFCASADRIWYGRDNIPPEHEGLEQRYGPLLDILEKAEDFKSSDHFFEIVAEQVISNKGALPLCQTKPIE